MAMMQEAIQRLRAYSWATLPQCKRVPGCCKALTTVIVYEKELLVLLPDEVQGIEEAKHQEKYEEGCAPTLSPPGLGLLRAVGVSVRHHYHQTPAVVTAAAGDCTLGVL